jgi:hypothetical protein
MEVYCKLNLLSTVSVSGSQFYVNETTVAMHDGKVLQLLTNRRFQNNGLAQWSRYLEMSVSK